MSLALFLHAVQHVGFGYDIAYHSAPETFLQGVTAAPPVRRIYALLLAGCIAGLGWWSLDRFGKPRISVSEAVGPGPDAGVPMPGLSTMVHAMLQAVTVALGSPLGREVAPREIGALAAREIGRRFGLASSDVRLLVACGAGGGLAAVYNVPFAGAVFTLEVLLVSASPRAALAAFATSMVAGLTARLGLGNVVQYSAPIFEVTASLLAWSIIAGPLLAGAAVLYSRLENACARRSAEGVQRIIWCLPVFGILGLIASLFPELPGNGKGPVQMALDGEIGALLALELLALKLLAVAGALRAGAAGGLLTPSMAVGALSSVLLGTLWNQFFPFTQLGAFAIVGAGAFLARSLAMPLTAFVLMIEFTGASGNAVVPLFLAIASGSMAKALFRQMVYRWNGAA